ncbi:MAG: hypothetical protein AAGA16_03885 [Cyanobacteria bacterium P01_E01_bin.35]
MTKKYTEYTEAFFQNLAQNQSELGINNLFQTNPWMSRNIDQVNNLSSQLSGLSSMAGSYLGFRVLVDRVFDDLYAIHCCLAIYDRQPVMFEFQYYCPRGEWRIQNFNVSLDFPQEVSQLTRANFSSVFR